MTARFDLDDGDELTATRTVVLTGDLDDALRFGVGPGWDQVAGLDAGDLPWQRTAPTSSCWGAGVRLRGARPAAAKDDDLGTLAEHTVRTPLDDLD